MSRTSEAQIVLRDTDLALVCNAKLERGRCKKLLITTDGHLVCKNGHSVTIGEAWNAYLSRGDWDLKAIGHIWPSRDALVEVIKRCASPEFLQADSREWQYHMVSYLPFLTWLIRMAESIDRKAASALKEYLEKAIVRMFPLLGRYLEALSKDMELSHTVGIQAREKIFRSLSTWTNRPQPEHYLVLWEIYVEAANYLKDECAMLYEHNLKESLSCIDSKGRHAPLYFLDETPRFRFAILPDPLWQSMVLEGPQIIFRYQPSFDIRWYVHWVGSGNTNDNVIGHGVIKCLNEHFYNKDDDYDWKFVGSRNDDHLAIFPSQRQADALIQEGKSVKEMSVIKVLEIMKELRVQLGYDLSYLLRSESV